MTTTAYWAPNQVAVPQVETYTFTAPSGVGNWYIATANGKSVTYVSVSGDTAATVAAGLLALLGASTGVPVEIGEITFANPSSAVLTATARVAGTPFANVPGIAGGLVLSTGNGLVAGIATVHTTPNASPSDVADAQNWLRITPPAAGVRAIPVNGDSVVVANTATPLLWNLDALTAVQFASYDRWQSFTGAIGLPENNPGGYVEWRQTDMRFVGPSGSVPAGGLTMTLGYSTGSGSGPTRERYNVGSQRVTLNALAAGSAADEWGVRFRGVHTANTFNVTGGVSLGIAMLGGEIATLASCTATGGASIGIGPGVTWTAASTLTVSGASALLNSAPATLALSNGASVTISTDGLTWTTVTMQGGSSLTMLGGGIITTLTMSQGCSIDKSQDNRALTVTNSTIDGDSCLINDPNNVITWTNATTVKQQVTAGPFLFTGPRTVKVT